MSTLLLDILSIIILSFVAYQDIKSRGVSWILFPVLFVLFLFKTLQYKSVAFTLTCFGMNMLMLGSVFLLLTFYFFVKHRKVENIIDTFIGLGDICFWLIAAVCFAPINFVLFFLGSLIVSLVFHLLSTRFQENVTVPLAGYQSLCLMILVIVENFHSSSFMLLDENWFIELIVF